MVQTAEQRQAYRKAHAAEIREYNAKYRLEHLDYHKQYAIDHKDRLNTFRRKRRKQDPVKYRAKDFLYASTHREQEHTKQKRYRDNQRIPHVYIFRNSENEVIYVGRAAFLRSRLEWHKARTAWWPEVTTIRKRRCTTWANSLVLEALFIRKYQPKHNQVGVTT